MKNNWENKYKPDNLDKITTSRDEEQKELYSSLRTKLSDPNISYEEQEQLLSETIDSQLELIKKTRDEISNVLDEHKDKIINKQLGLDNEDIFVTNEYINDGNNYKKVPFFFFDKKKKLKEKMEESKEKYDNFRLKKREIDKLKMDEEEKTLADELDKKAEEARLLKNIPFYKFSDRQKLEKLREEIKSIYSKLLEYRNSKFDTRSEEEKVLSGELKEKTEEFSSTPMYKLRDRKNKRDELSNAYENLLNFRNRNN